MRRLSAIILSLALGAPLRAAEFAEIPAESAAAIAPTTPLSQPPALAALPELTAAAPEVLLAPVQPQTSSPAAKAVLTGVASAKDSAPAQAAAYDGVKAPRAAETPVTAAPAQPAGFLRRLNAATDSHHRAERLFERAVPLGILAGVSAPVLWHAASPGTALYSAPLALTAMLLVFGSITFWRALRFLILRRDVRDSRRGEHRAKAVVAGAALGILLAAAPQIFQPQIVEKSAGAVAPGIELRAVPGAALSDATVAELMANPEGRDVLNQLRGRDGRLYMPRFYVGRSDDAVAAYKNILDAVFINTQEITARGWTVDEFLKDPAKQRAFASDFKTTFAHELRHADQARRSLTDEGQWTKFENFESEYESYTTEVLFTHARLKLDPDVALTSNEFGEYLGALDGYDRFIKGIDGSYSKDAHIDTAYFRAYQARMRAEWPRFMVEANLLLARRDRAHPKMAQRYLDAARAVAAAHGLPDPLR